MTEQTNQTAVQQRESAAAIDLRKKKENAWNLLQDMKKGISAVLPKHLTPERMATIAYTAMQRNPRLLECTKESIIGSIMTAAMLGLEPSGPLGHGALIPYKDNRRGTFECQFQPMYQGLLELARRSGFILSVQLREVRKGDTYSYRFGLHSDLTHIPMDGEGSDDPNRPVTHVYCVIDLIGGGQQWDQISWEEGLAHGARFSPSWDDRLNGGKGGFKLDSVWADDPLAMIRKTILKKVLKLCPKSPEMAAALLGDDGAERGRSVRTTRVADGVFDVDFGDEPETNRPNGREAGKVDLKTLQPSDQTNRGHDDTKLGQVVGSGAGGETKEAKQETKKPEPETTLQPDAALTDAQKLTLENLRTHHDIAPGTWLNWAKATFNIKAVSKMTQRDYPAALSWHERGGKADA